MNEKIKKMLNKSFTELRFSPRFVFAADPNNGDRYRFRFHQSNQSSQSRMASQLRKRGLVVREWGGFLRPEWRNNPRGVLHPEPVVSTPNRWLCLLQGLWEVSVDLVQTSMCGKR